MSQTSAAADEAANLDRDALLMKFFITALTAQYDAILKKADAASLQAYRETGALTTKPRFEGLPLGTRTVAEPKAKLKVTDVRKFEAWAESGGHGEWKFVPNDAWQRATLQYGTWDEANEVAVTKDGEIIPGVTLIPAAEPFSVTQKPDEGTFRQLLEMLHSGKLSADLRALAPAPEGLAEPQS
ncbi:hypothetical protein OG723_44275 (plasmid) [Streptomyces sp. NBC_01278]|uniref:hypothetical protein n=1 Tax=Streptomyces sp. NBC_01278 TaxID=2903809 RepID=UPI002E32DA9A|nr:hypothetical protein [Streptomyces sp. NBC_01278]